MKKDGFTLVELLVVIVVMAVLASAIMIFINPARRFRQANDARIKSDISQIANALLAYYTINRHYPTVADGGLSALVTDNDVRTIPMPPGGGSPAYSYDLNSACGTPPYTGCEAIVYYALRDPQTAGNVWCWQSIIGTFTEETICPVP